MDDRLRIDEMVLRSRDRTDTPSTGALRRATTAPTVLPTRIPRVNADASPIPLRRR
jgi:hypothetical protein